MVINWYGEACFKVQVGDLSLITDPFSAADGDAQKIGLGLAPPRSKADVTLKTFVDYPAPYARTENVTIIGPGEYEMRGIEVSGWPLHGADPKEEKSLRTAYLVSMEDLRLGFLGYISKMPDASFIEAFGEVDIIFIPGGAPYLDVEQSAKLIKQLRPKIVIPSLFKIPGLKRKAEDIKPFLDELDQEAKPEEKLVIKKKDLPASTRVCLLKV